MAVSENFVRAALGKVMLSLAILLVSSTWSFATDPDPKVPGTIKQDIKVECDPVWMVDAGSSNPYYDDGGSTVRDADSVTMFDAPSADAPLMQLRNQNPGRNLRYDAHYEAFLVCAGKVCAKLSWTVTQDFPAKAKEPDKPVRDITKAESPASNPDKKQVKLLEKYPAPPGGGSWIK